MNTIHCAHSSSGICPPIRFALLTGQYHWRLTYGIVELFGTPMFKDSDIMLPQILKTSGYTIACIDKWHLEWNWNFIHKEPSGLQTFWGKTQKVYLLENLDWTIPVTGRPIDRGFDYYFGDHARTCDYNYYPFLLFSELIIQGHIETCSFLCNPKE